MPKQPPTLATTVVKQLARAKAGQALQDFAALYLADLPVDELSDYRASDVRAHLSEAYDFIRQHDGRKGLHLRVHNPEWCNGTVIETLMPDQPFLISTVWAELDRLEIQVKLSIHPILGVNRNNKTPKFAAVDKIDESKGWHKESLIHIEVPRLESKSERQDVANKLKEALTQAQWAAEDFPSMLGTLGHIIASTEQHLPRSAENEEKLRFLHWLTADNFIFLGYRHYELKRTGKGTAKDPLFQLNKGKSKGILRDEKKSSIAAPTPVSKLAPNLQEYLGNDNFLIITKGLEKSRVHRRVDMDYIGIKEFNDKGEVVSEHRFVGLFTSKAYTTNPSDIPIVGHKISCVLEMVPPMTKSGFNYKSLVNILHTFPKDELLQASAKELYELSTGILALQERPQVKLFIRRCNHERMISSLIYLPRDRMNSQVRVKVQEQLMKVYNGEAMEWRVTLGTQQLASIYTRIRTAPPEPPEVDKKKLEAKLRDITTTWEDRLYRALLADHGNKEGGELFKRYRQAFEPGYQDHTITETALADLAVVETMNKDKQDFEVTLNQLKDGCNFSLKIFNRRRALHLSDIMPTLENLGLHITTEYPSVVNPAGKGRVWLHDFQVSSEQCERFSGEDAQILTQAIKLIWNGELEDDRLGGLIFAGINLQQLVILRALCAYVHQLSRRFSKDYVHSTLVKHPRAATQLVLLFEALHNPELSKTESEKQIAEIEANLTNNLRSVMILDEDRILRRLYHVVKASVRTNVWQRKTVTEPLSFKVRSGAIPDIVKPAPLFEIFVYHSCMEGVHLRGGRVARGGLRWSDRLEDYRTEILGLVKAQMVKNAIIVPEGSKGGFVLKGKLANNREALQAQVVAAYETFIKGLLSLTDNIIDGKTVNPNNVRCLDEPDPYLVVAADKGTATFSDVANKLSLEACYWGKHKGFWLGDAFASGGSNGYDHKAMGITARGAWECVKYHFRSLGKDIQSEPFTAIGIGDMGGDVFGNGMLLSRQTKLVAAFNHLHIFIDPDPDPETSYAERERLFNSPGKSGWDNYNAKLISKGGGVFERSAKEVELTPEICRLLGTEETRMDPNKLMRLILQAPVELWWNGGIGTFVKASTEDNTTVGDRANDELRIDAKQLRAKVVGEGGNLGFTQRARIEYALAGGHIHTDSIDNAAGVNTSDHEVNIKILLSAVKRAGKLADKRRNTLLEEMTEDVAKGVLYANFLQAQAIAIKLRHAAAANDVTLQLQHYLAKSGQLDPELEVLPDADELERRKRTNQGYTSPELSLLIAYAKIDIYRDLLGSKLPDDEAVANYLVDYFPPQLQEKYKSYMADHHLKREIITTMLADEVVNRMGITFVHRLRRETGHNTANIVRTYLIAKRLFKAEKWWQQLEGLSADVSADIQLELLDRVKKLLEFSANWMLTNCKQPYNIDAELERFAKPFKEITERLKGYLPDYSQALLRRKVKNWVEGGLSAELADELSLLRLLTHAPDIAALSLRHTLPTTTVLAAYFKLDTTLGLAELHTKVHELPVGNNWQRIANQTVVDDLYRYRHDLTDSILKVIGKNGGVADEAFKKWRERHSTTFAQYQEMRSELNAAKSPSHAMLSVITSQLKNLTR